MFCRRRLFEQAELCVTHTEGGLACQPEIRKGWKTYNFEGENRSAQPGQRSSGRLAGSNARSQHQRGGGLGFNNYLVAA